MPLSQNFALDLKNRFSEPWGIVPQAEIPKFVEPAKDLPISLLVGIFQRLQACCEQHNGLGLSATQVGIPISAFVATVTNKQRFFVDCEYDGQDREFIDCIESCLSLPGKNGLRTFKTSRYAEVLVSGFEVIGVESSPKLVTMSELFSKVDAVVMQHEIDHQKAILISEIGRELIVKPISN